MKSISTLLMIPVMLIGCTGYQKIDQGQDKVQISLFMPAADEVLFFASADRFQPKPMEKDVFGFWRVEVPPNRNFSYFYQVDTVTYIPDCLEKELDDFGAANCIYLHR